MHNNAEYVITSKIIPIDETLQMPDSAGRAEIGLRPICGIELVVNNRKLYQNT